MRKQSIKPNEWYSLQDIVRGEFFPWARSFKSAKRLLEHDIKNGNILQPIIIGSGRGMKYHFKGINIIKYKKNMNI